MRFFLILPLLFFTFLGFAQTDISGNWIGTITQNEGGYRSKYKFELFLFQDGSEITGRSYVYVDDIYAEMILRGRIIGNTLSFQETEIIQFKELQGMEWCIKSCLLQLSRLGKKMKLEGKWEGTTSFGTCIPGNVFLQKIEPRV